MANIRKENWLSQKPFRAGAGLAHRIMQIGEAEAHDAYLAAYRPASQHTKVIAAYYGGWGGGWSASITTAQTGLRQDYWYIYLDDDGGGAAQIVNDASGLVVTTSATNNHMAVIQTARRITPANDQLWHFYIRGKTDNLDLGLCFGFAARTLDFDILGNIGTPASVPDVVCWSTTLNATDGVFKPRVRGNAGTIADGSALPAITANTDFALGITFHLSSSGSSGKFWYDVSSSGIGRGNKPLNGVNFTSAQIAQLNAWLTTPPTTMYGFVQFRNSTANSRNFTIQELTFEVERTS